MKRKVILVSAGMSASRARLQPWKYLWETARGLARTGHDMMVVTDEKSLSEGNLSGGSSVEGLSIRTCKYLKHNRHGPGTISELLEEEKPELVLWHVGKTSFLHGSFSRRTGSISIGIFTSPLYNASELLQIGILRLVGNLSLSAVHILGTFTPSWMLRRFSNSSGLDWLVTETQTTAVRLQQDRLWSGQIKTIIPGVDELWTRARADSTEYIRRALGITASDTIFLYLGARDLLRGLPILLRAIREARRANPVIRLVVLAREPGAVEGDFKAEEWPKGSGVWIVKGMLHPEEVIQWMAACDAVVLPFLLVPSDAPLSLLEAAALGKPILTTRCACLPEFAAFCQAALTDPGNIKSLSTALLLLAAQKGSKQFATFTRTWEQVGEDWSQFVESL